MYGLKIDALIGLKMYYSYNLDIHSEKQLNGPYQVNNRECNIVQRLIMPCSDYS